MILGARREQGDREDRQVSSCPQVHRPTGEAEGTTEKAFWEEPTAEQVPAQRPPVPVSSAWGDNNVTRRGQDARVTPVRLGSALREDVC